MRKYFIMHLLVQFSIVRQAALAVKSLGRSHLSLPHETVAPDAGLPSCVGRGRQERKRGEERFGAGLLIGKHEFGPERFEGGGSDDGAQVGAARPTSGSDTGSTPMPILIMPIARPRISGLALERVIVPCIVL